MKHTDIWEAFVAAESSDQLQELRERFNEGGYSLFSDLLNNLKHELTAAEEDRLELTKRWIAKGREVMPDPARLSPSWERVWDDYERLVALKQEALQAISPSERDGEWQIMMDNPYTNDNISCYPSLSFVEAAYLYAYFGKDRKPNEYIRLQKIVNLLSAGEN